MTVSNNDENRKHSRAGFRRVIRILLKSRGKKSFEVGFERWKGSF